jgi:hypothetical protein
VPVLIWKASGKKLALCECDMDGAKRAIHRRIDFSSSTVDGKNWRNKSSENPLGINKYSSASLQNN